MKPFDGEARAQKVAGKVCSRSIDAARRAGLENQGAVRQRCRQHRCRDEAALEGSDVYEVDTLLEKRRRGGVVTYLVKWKGDRDQDSWEPVINIPRAIVREFEEERGPVARRRRPTTIGTTTPRATAARMRWLGCRPPHRPPP